MIQSPITFFPRTNKIYVNEVNWWLRINSLRVALTSKCNYSCPFCHNEGASKNIHNKWVRRFSELLINVVRAGVELWIRKVTITGWEPLLRRDVVNIVNWIHRLSQDIIINITSNGFLLTPNKISNFSWKVHKMNINFQSAREEVFEEITWVQWLRKITSVIPLLQSAGIHVTLNFVLTSKNQNEIDYVIKYAQLVWCDLKVLELIREFAQHDELPKQSYHDLIQRLSLQYWGWQFFEISPSEYIAYFDTTKGKRKLRFISSYCNTFDGDACTKHWELLVSDQLELKNCIMPKSTWVNIYDAANSWDIEIIKKVLINMQQSLWVCP